MIHSLSPASVVSSSRCVTASDTNASPRDFSRTNRICPASNLFIPPHRGKDRIIGHVFSECGRQAVGRQRGEDALSRRRIEAGFLNREARRGDESEADRFAVEEATIASGRLDPVTDGVSEVQQGAGPGGFALVFFDDGGFDRDIPGDKFDKVLANGGFRLDEIKQGSVADRGMFDDFGEPLVEFPLGERVEGGDVGDDESRLVKGSEQVFTLGRIHPGLASDRAVDLAYDRRRDLHAGNAALENGGGESGEVAHNAPAERNEEGFAIKPGAQHLAAHFGYLSHALRRFSGRHGR